MRRTGLWWAAALVVASNLGAWGFAALNRSGEPEAVLELTERELRLPRKQSDNTALTLALMFELPRQPGPLRLPREPGWFDRAKLESIGFDCSRPVTAENALFYRQRLPRTTYAALEYEGETWRRQMQESVPVDPGQTAARAPDADGVPGAEGSRKAPGDPTLESHLVAVDVGNDPAALRQRHPDRRRVVIVEATAELQFVNNPGQEPFLAGRVTSVLPGEINVPREWLTLLEGLQIDRRFSDSLPMPHEPRYRVTVKWGRSLEPWVSDVKPMDTLMAIPPAR